MTSEPLVRLIVLVPADVQLLLNVEPPVKLIWSATSWVHCAPPEAAPPEYFTVSFGKQTAPVTFWVPLPSIDGVQAVPLPLTSLLPLPVQARRSPNIATPL